MNIDEMQAGLELDALIAEKVMGWVKISWDGAMCAPGSLTERWIWKLCSPERAAELLESSEYRLAIESDLPAKKQWRDGIPDFSTDLAAAWQVVEKTKEYQGAFTIFADEVIEFCGARDLFSDVGIRVVLGRISALIICRAALKAME